MIITLTVNPAVDETLWLDRLTLGAVNRPNDSHLDPAGKGVNVSRMARRLGWPTIAFGFVAGDLGRIVENALDAEHVEHHFVHIPGQTRVNVTINVRGERGATSFFGPGPAADLVALERLDETLGFWLQACRVLVLAGSLLPGMPAEFYARWTRRARGHGVRVIVDADGEPLKQALLERPYLIKPNLKEAEHLVGRSLPDDTAVLGAARQLAERADVVVISLGESGAVCVSREHSLRVVPPAIDRLSTVGSGDSLVAGIAVSMARGDTLENGLRLGTAAGAATAMSPGTALGTLDEIARLMPAVRIDPL